MLPKCSVSGPGVVKKFHGSGAKKKIHGVAVVQISNEMSIFC